MDEARPMIRKTVVPRFNREESLGDMAILCEGAVSAIRFDATVLPVDDLVFTMRTDGLELVVDMRVPDRDQAAVQMIHIWRTVICPWAPIRSNGPDYIVRWMRETIASVMAHEVDESITLDGERVFDPHRRLAT